MGSKHFCNNYISQAFVVDFNIFYRETPDSQNVQVTHTGRANFVYNGIPDWVYEGERLMQ